MVIMLMIIIMRRNAALVMIVIIVGMMRIVVRMDVVVRHIVMRLVVVGFAESRRMLGVALARIKAVLLVFMRSKLVRFGVVIFPMRRVCGGFGRFNDPALDPLAAAATARTAVPVAPAAGTVLVLFLGFAMGTLFGLDQRLTVRDRDLIIVRMNFAEGEKAVTIAAIFDKSRL